LSALAKPAAMRHTAGLERFGKKSLRGIVNKSIGKTLQFYWRQTRALTMGAQGVVLDQQDRVLLIRHTYRPGWHFPGGGVERNETIETSVSRELQEEAGIIIDARPELFGVYANFMAFPSDHIALFVVRHWSQPVVPAPNREIAEQMFAARDDLPEGTIAPVHRRLAEILGHTERQEQW